MNRELPSRWRDPIIGGILFAAMIVLALLQYRWIGQVSESDRDRLQRNLRNAVLRFSDDFNSEVERLAQVLVAGGGGPLGIADRSLEERLDLWRGFARHPQMVKKVWAAAAPDLPESLHRLRDRVTSPGQDFRGGRGRNTFNFEPAVPALAVPRLRAPESNNAPPQIEWWIVELDRTYIAQTVLPEIAARDLTADYRVQIFEGPNLIYESEPGSRLTEDDETVSAALFNIRQNPFGRGGGRPGGFSGGFKNGDFKGPDFADNQGKRFPGEENGWRVVAVHESGTTSELVASLRLRNLGVSFGILLLMGASVIMLMRSTRQANALAVQQMEFVAGVTHELRTPLAVILSASQNLADGVAAGEAQAKRYGGVIFGQTKRLSNMVEQVLRFAGLSSQHGELQRTAVDVGQLLDEALVDSEPELAAAGAEVDVDVPESIAQIDGDRSALLHCFRNLLGNAAKHGAGAPIRLRAVSKGDAVEIYVEDAGPGIEAGDLPHIFEPFYRGSRAKDEQVSGSGLGLSLVKKIVDAHGGSVDVTSSPGQGTRFRVTLPAAKG